MRGTAVAVVFAGMMAGAADLAAMVGDTREQLVAKHGNGKDLGDQMLFSVDERYSLTATFQNGKCTMEIYSCRTDADGITPPLTPDDVQTLLKKNAAGQSWATWATKSGSKFWGRSDKKITARMVEKEGVLVFMGTSDGK
jgi:hypothetical protein